MNNKTFNKILRALYQIFVVGILLLPIRLLTGIYTVACGLMAPSRYTTIKDYFSIFAGATIEAYKARINWVKYGYDYEEDCEEQC